MPVTKIPKFLIPLAIGLVIVLMMARLVWPAFQSKLDPGVQRSNSIESLRSEDYDHQLISATIAGRPVQLLIVNQPTSISQGLSGKETIGADGMLFVLGDDQQTVFWMKDMRFDLDLVWLRDGQIVGISEQVPAPSPDTLDGQLEVYPSEQPVDMVLEIPAGQSAVWGLQPGDLLVFDFQLPE